MVCSTLIEPQNLLLGRACFNLSNGPGLTAQSYQLSSTHATTLQHQGNGKNITLRRPPKLVLYHRMKYAPHWYSCIDAGQMIRTGLHHSPPTKLSRIQFISVKVLPSYPNSAPCQRPVTLTYIVLAPPQLKGNVFESISENTLLFQ